MTVLLPLLAALLTSAATHPCSGGDTIQGLFEWADSDHDGLLSFQEGARYQQATGGPPVTWRDWRALCRLLGTNPHWGIHEDQFGRTYRDSKLATALGTDSGRDVRAICAELCVPRHYSNHQ